MKKIIIVFSFLILVAASYSRVVPHRDNVKILSETPAESFQMSIPKDGRKHTVEPVMVIFSRVHTDIYPTRDKVRLSNDRMEEIILNFDEDINWTSDGENVTLVLKSRRDKRTICEFLSRSRNVDFYLYKTNTVYEVRDIKVDSFKSYYQNI